MSKCKVGNIPIARHTAMQLMRNESGMTYTDIAKIFGVHYTAVMYACKQPIPRYLEAKAIMERMKCPNSQSQRIRRP